MRKLTPQELREQFDQDVERFSNIQAGQNSIMDSVLVSDLMEKAIKAMNPQARTACDIGCGAGNYALRVLRQFPEIELHVVGDCVNPARMADATKAGYIAGCEI